MLKNNQPTGKINKYIFTFTGVILLFWYLLSAAGFYFTLPPVDEGMLLSAGRRLHLGDIPHKDFFSYIPPFSAVLGSLSLELFGGYTSQRIVTIILTFTSIVLYTSYINNLFEGKKLSLQILSIIVYIFVTLPIGYVFVHHNISKGLFVIILLLLLKLVDSTDKYKGDKLTVTLALTVFLCGLTNQVSGAYYFIGCFVVCAMAGGFRRAFIFSAPIVIGALLFLGWLKSNDMIAEYFDDTLIWVLDTYAKNNTYSIWHEQVFKIRNSSNLLVIIENIFILTLKAIIIITGLLFIFLNKLRKRELYVFIFIFLNMATLVQSFNSMNAYYIFALLFPFILMYFGGNRVLLIFIIFLTSFQVARSTTYLPRVLHEYKTHGVCDINGVQLICSEQVRNIKNLAHEMDENRIKIYTIVGRSPVLYGLLNIDNNTRFDQIFPPFVREADLKKLAISITGKCVITDFTDNYLFSNEITKYGSTSQRDVGESLMYESKKNIIQNEEIFKIVNDNVTQSFQRYAISCIP